MNRLPSAGTLVRLAFEFLLVHGESFAQTLECPMQRFLMLTFHYRALPVGRKVANLEIAPGLFSVERLHMDCSPAQQPAFASR